jgi:hypothetical protein
MELMAILQKFFKDLGIKIKMILDNKKLDKEFVTRSRDIILKRFTAPIISRETLSTMNYSPFKCCFFVLNLSDFAKLYLY